MAPSSKPSLPDAPSLQPKSDNANAKNVTDRRGSGVGRSPSGLSLSRPKSMLMPTRASTTTSASQSSPSASSAAGSKATITNHRTPSVYSVSPSVRSMADHTASLSPTVASTSAHAIGQSGGASGRSESRRTGGPVAGLQATDSSALSRLRRVASNVSIASSMRNRLTLSDTTPPRPDSERSQAKGSRPGESSKATATEAPQGSPPNAPFATSGDNNTNIASENSGESAANANATKRQLDVGGDATLQAKQARRKTWFGFGGGAETSEGDHAEVDAPDKAIVPTDASRSDAEDTQFDPQDDHDGQATIKSRPSELQQNQGTVKAWLPWRMPPEGVDHGHAGDTVASYTDSVRRYISWGTQNDTTGSTSSSPANAGWGWPAWRSASTPAKAAEATESSIPRHDDNTVTSVEQIKPSDVDAAATVKVAKDGVVAMELDTKQGSRHKANLSDATSAQHSALNPSEASPAQGSFIYRWMPSWNRSATPSNAPSASDEATGSRDEGAESSGDNNSDAFPKPPPGPPTPAEKYKAEALAHLGAKNAVLNNATRSAWINYFGSRSAAPPPRTGQLSEDEEAEVMRISDGKQPELSSSTGAKAAVTGKLLAAGKANVEPNSAKQGESRPPSSKMLEAKPKQIMDPAPVNSRPATPLTRDKETARRNSKVTAADATGADGKKGAGVEGGKTSTVKPSKPTAPNLLLPTFDDTFATAPRSITPRKGVWEKTLSLFFNTEPNSSVRSNSSKNPSNQRRPSILAPGGPSSRDAGSRTDEAQERLPRLWSIMGDKDRAISRGCKGIRKVTVIGIHGWFSKGPIRNLFGEPTGTSTKFAGMMTEAVKRHFRDAGYELNDDQLTSIALEADGQVSERVDKSFAALLSKPEWISNLLASDAVFFAAHSQGSIVATHLLARLVEQRHLDPRHSRVVLLCMCGIHNGPFAHLRGSITSYYMNTFETPAAKELFEFQNGNSPVSRLYAASLRIVIAAGIKLVYMASLDDQVVPLYSALHSAASHPSILRGIFCDGAAFPRVDFLTNLLSFCVNVRNAGLGDHHLATLLSSSVAGSLYGGLGHSLIYDEPEVYRLAVRYLLEVTSPAAYPTARSGQPNTPTSALATSSAAHLLPSGIPPLELDDAFTLVRNQKWNNNPYALPWSLRGLLEDESVRAYFSDHIDKLVTDYLDWQPTTKTLKDVQFRLEPIRLVAHASQRAAATSDRDSESKASKKTAAAPDASGTGATSNSKL